MPRFPFVIVKRSLWEKMLAESVDNSDCRAMAKLALKHGGDPAEVTRILLDERHPTRTSNR